MNDAPVAVVTGANSGLGLATARALAAAGYLVVLACRDAGRAEAAAAVVAEVATGPPATAVVVDLADQASVATCAAGLEAAHPAIDVVVANAGVMAIPWMATADGFETQLATNHFGHFALIGRLWPQLQAASDPARVVVVSSLAASAGGLRPVAGPDSRPARFEDLQWDTTYDPWAAYSRSKLANLLYARELHRLAGDRVAAVAVHPGYSATSLWANGPAPFVPLRRRLTWRVGARLFAQSAAAGARPAIRAATDPSVRSGSYLAPRGPLHLWGAPTTIRFPKAARDDDVARLLWEVSEGLTGVRYP